VGVDMAALTKLHSSGMPPAYGSIGCLRDVVERFDIVGDVLAMGHDEAIGLQNGWYVTCNCSSIPVVFSPISSTL
jgi:hypothetical protein